MVHTMSKHDTPARRSRRVHSAAFKRDLVARSLLPGASVSALALEAGVNANLVFKWRRMHLRARRSATASRSTSPVLLPVTIAMPPPAVPRTSPAAANGGGCIEIDIQGARVRLHGEVHPASLRCVLQALRERA